MARDRTEAALQALEERVRNLERLLKQAELRIATLAAAPRILDVELSEDLPPGETGNAKVMDFDGTDLVDSGETVAVFNPYGVQFSSGAPGFAIERPVQRRWELLVGDCTE